MKFLKEKFFLMGMKWKCCFRQDQLIVQMIRLMDDLLRSDGLDLRLTPYSVLATSTSEGFVQFVKAIPLREVISNWGTVQVNYCFDFFFWQDFKYSI